MSVTVELRGAGDARFRAIVSEGYGGLVGALGEVERTLPWFVEREFRAYLGCGDPSLGFAWLRCDACDHDRLVLFSCKTRGFCPSCAGRRMAEKAAHWVDRVIPHVATRQFVLTVPWKRRWLLARRPRLAGGVLRLALRYIERFYRAATGRRDGRCGAVTAIQRFGSALNLNLHFHIVHLDGVYARGGGGALRFLQATPSTSDVEPLVVEIGDACERLLANQGFAGEAEDTELDDADDVQARLQQLSLLGGVAVGERAGKAVRRVQRLGGPELPLGPRCAGYEGYNLHATVSFIASDRRGLEHLCRYVLRPPVAVGRVERLQDGTVRVGMKRTWSDGTSAIDLSPTELVEKLAAIVPPPRAHTIVYAGVLAGNAAWRGEVVPKVATSEQAAREARQAARKLTRRPAVGSDRPGWAAYEDPLRDRDPHRVGERPVPGLLFPHRRHRGAAHRGPFREPGRQQQLRVHLQTVVAEVADVGGDELTGADHPGAIEDHQRDAGLGRLAEGTKSIHRPGGPAKSAAAAPLLASTGSGAAHPSGRTGGGSSTCAATCSGLRWRWGGWSAWRTGRSGSVLQTGNATNLVDGTSAIDPSPTDLVEKLAAIVPPPRAHTIVYAGVLAGNAAWRSEVVPKVATSERRPGQRDRRGSSRGARRWGATGPGGRTC